MKQERSSIGFIGTRATCSSHADAEAALSDLKSEIQRAESAHPGLMRRTAFLNKSQDEIEKRLVKRLVSAGKRDAATFVRTMLRGKKEFSPVFRAQLIPSDFVADAADALRDIKPSSIFKTDEYDYDDFKPWRELFLAAAERREAILVY